MALYKFRMTIIIITALALMWNAEI